MSRAWVCGVPVNWLPIIDKALSLVQLVLPSLLKRQEGSVSEPGAKPVDVAIATQSSASASREGKIASARSRAKKAP